MKPNNYMMRTNWKYSKTKAATMTTTPLRRENNTSINEFVPMIISAVIVTLVLLYIDEGYYNFSWMADIGNWIVGIIYAGIIAALQIAIYKLVLFPLRGNLRTGLSIGLGIFTALTILFFVIFG